MNEFSRTSRIVFFLAGLFSLGLAVAAPPAQLAANYPFSGRMAQHLLMQLVAPPLFLMAVAGGGRRGWRIKPAVAWLCGLGAMWAWHTPTLCNAAVRSPSIHIMQTCALLFLGTLFWWPIVGANTRQQVSPPMGILYLFTACLGCTIMGILITFAPSGLYLGSPLGSALNDWQFATPDDQRVGGLLMWVPGCLIYICGIMGLLARWYAAPETTAFPTGHPERIS